MLNPYDEYAVEEGLMLRENSRARLSSFLSAATRTRKRFAKALAMGCDKAVLLKDSSTRDSYAVARALADYAKEYSPDVVLCGKQSIDYDDAQVGGLCGGNARLPSISVVVKLEIAAGAVVAERKLKVATKSFILNCPLSSWPRKA